MGILEFLGVWLAISIAVAFGLMLDRDGYGAKLDGGEAVMMTIFCLPLICLLVVSALSLSLLLRRKE